ncbi:MAG: hypothetical protein AAF577_16050 [Pseudomonadota bacterium]
MRRSLLPMACAALAGVVPEPAASGPADVIAAEARQSGATWTISATVAHADTGWEHYADAFRVVAPDGTVLGTRVLHHPHVNEQPFTRSLSGVAIPEGITDIRVEAHDSVHGWGGAGVTVTLP